MSRLQQRLQQIQNKMSDLHEQLQNSSDNTSFDLIKRNAPVTLKIAESNAEGTVQFLYKNGTVHTTVHIEDSAPNELKYTLQNLESVNHPNTFTGTITTSDEVVVLEQMQITQNVLTVLNYRKYTAPILISFSLQYNK